MRCGKVERLLTPYLDGRLDEAAQRTLEAHLEGCGPCRETHALLAMAQRSLAAEGPAEPPEGLAERAARAAFTADRPAVGFSLEDFLRVLRWPAAATAASSVVLAIGLVVSSPQRPPSAATEDEAVAALRVPGEPALDDESSGLGELLFEEEE